jgi:putative addiction module CopG family antidote
MKVALAPGLEEFVAMKVKSGDYQDAAEVIRESLRQWKENEKNSVLEPEWLEHEIIEGLESSEMPVNGEFWKSFVRNWREKAVANPSGGNELFYKGSRPSGSQKVLASACGRIIEERQTGSWNLRNRHLWQLPKNPDLGSQRSFRKLANVRSRLVVGFPNYLVFYQIPEDAVVILRVLHGMRDLPRFFRRRAR